MVSVRRGLIAAQLVEALLIFWFCFSHLSAFNALLLFVLIWIGWRAVAVFAICWVTGRLVNPNPLDGKSFAFYFIEEYLAFILIYGFLHLIPKNRLSTSSNVSENHIIFIHGFLCTSGFWQVLADKTLLAGFSVSHCEQPSAFASLENYALLISNEVERIAKENPHASIQLVAFSMGGLACRFWQNHFYNSHVKKIITVHTPHQGTEMAKIPALVRAKNGLEMLPESDWINELKAEERVSSDSIPFQAIVSMHDTIVVPAKRGRYLDNDIIRGAKGHLTPAIDSSFHDIVLESLTSNGPGQSH